ncbi:MAG: GDP-L-fucose synthase [Nitrospirota bacterium]
MDKLSKIYIAGHRGLVGSATLRSLKKEGYSNFLLKTHKELDLQVQRNVENFFKKGKPDYVFLAAARVGGILANNTYPADFIYNNLVIQVNVIHAAYKYGVKKLLFLGSSCIYPKYAPQPMKEEYLLTGLLEPTNEPYAVAKIAGIKMCQSYNRQYRTNFISVMPTNLYGPYDNFDLENSHVLPALIRKFHLARLLKDKRYEEIKRDVERFSEGFNLSLDLNLILEKSGITSEYVKLWGSGTPRREFLHVDDLADACVFLMNHYDSGEIINIGTGRDVTIKELAELIKEIVGFDGEIVWDKTKPDGMVRKLLDISKLKSLGWTPKISLRDGIKQTYEWYVKFSGNL